MSLTLKQVQAIAEMVSGHLPPTLNIEWTYKIGSKADKLNFTIKKD